MDTVGSPRPGADRSAPEDGARAHSGAREGAARAASIAASVILFLLAAAATCSGVAYATGADFPAWTLAIGAFLVEAFPVVWVFVPAYLIASGLFLAIPGFRRDRALGLSLSVFPFLTFVILVRFLDDPDAAAARFPVLSIVPHGLSVAVLALLFVAECVAIVGLAKALFPSVETDGGRRPAGAGVLGGRTSTRRTDTGRGGSFLLLGDRRAPEKEKAAEAGAKGFEFKVPEVPELPALRIHGDKVDENVDGSAGARRAEGGDGAAEIDIDSIDVDSVDDAETLVAPRAGSESSARPSRPGSRAPNGTDGLGGIVFESVPPQGKAARSGSDEEGGEGAAEPAPGRRPKKRKHYSVPIEGILNSYPDGQYWIIDDATRSQAEVLKRTLEEFRVQAEVTGIRKGPVITMFEILPAPGVKLSKIVGLQDNIALRLAAQSLRIVAPIPGKHAVGIEVPNPVRAIVSFREMIENDAFTQKKSEIPVVLGKDIQGEVQVIDLTSNPHILIAGATGSGKSVCVNAIILSILYKRRPDEVKLIMIDPKIVELKLYNDIPHLLTPVITEPKRAFQALQYCICEMERRYSLLDGMGVRDIKSYNKRVKERNIATEPLPYIVVIIDEFADLMATTGKELESTLARLAAMSRAVGIHLVLATQRPSIDVITGLIKANIPTRIAFMVASKTDSRIIIDMVGAEKLLGRGDMLYASATEPFPVRIQGAFVSEEEVERAVEHVKTLGEPEYIDDEIFIEEGDEDGEQSLFADSGDDPMFDKALEIVLQAGKASASYIQRRLKIGYNRAARLVEIMEERGIVGPQNGSKPRDILHMPDRPRPARKDDALELGIDNDSD